VTKVMVLGSSGMLGRSVSEVLRQTNFQVVTAGRADSDTYFFNAEESDIRELLGHLNRGDYLVNAIGIITHRIDEADESQVAHAFRINAEFPKALALAAAASGIRVIQIATDCVYDGANGHYSESIAHNAKDVYGLSKSKGEVKSVAVMHIRCSIIGPEKGRNLSLFEWVRHQPSNAEIFGFTDHRWNGVTTYAFGRVVAGIISQSNFQAGVCHLVPEDEVTKAQLVRLLAAKAGRSDLVITDKATGQPMDRTLITDHPSFNAKLWASAGYSHIPTVAELIGEMPIN